MTNPCVKHTTLNVTPPPPFMKFGAGAKLLMRKNKIWRRRQTFDANKTKLGAAAQD